MIYIRRGEIISSSDKLKNYHQRSIALSLADLHDSGIAALAVSILLAILCEKLFDKIHLLCVLLAACALLRHLESRITNSEDLTSCMKS